MRKKFFEAIEGHLIGIALEIKAIRADIAGIKEAIEAIRDAAPNTEITEGISNILNFDGRAGK